MRNLLGFPDSFIGGIHHSLSFFFFFPLPFSFPRSAYRENQRESPSQTSSIEPSASTVVPLPLGVLLAVVGGLIYVYEYLLLARAALFLAFHTLQRFFVNFTHTFP